MRIRSTTARVLKGAALGCIPMLITWAMPPNDRSPYIIAYPAVILSAWLWEAAGSIATAAIAGLLIEHFMFSTQKIPLGPAVAGSSFRVAAFVLGSILAGV